MEWIGSLDGDVNAVIRPQVTGYLIKQNYREGDLVKQGQPLFEIDPRTFEAAVDEAKGQRAQQVAGRTGDGRGGLRRRLGHPLQAFVALCGHFDRLRDHNAEAAWVVGPLGEYRPARLRLVRR